jgi:hypothetical protein
MTRSVVRPRTSPGLRTSRHGAALLALIFGGITVLSAGSAFAEKKKAATTDEEPAAQKTDEAAPEKTAAPSAQVQDVEKPQRVLDNSQEAPKTDSLGHVHFGSPNGEGLGRVAVKAPPEQKIKVFLEGRYFGTAPLTIYSVPKGDYIVEATYPTGKQVSKPVTVGENEETAVDLGGAATLTSDGGNQMFNAEMTPTRLLWTKGFLIGAAVGVVGAIVFGILELKTESDYNNVPLNDPNHQAQLDSLANTGKNYALYTNISIAVAAIGGIGAAITGYPLVFSSSEKKMAVVLTPAVGPSFNGGVATLRF